MTITPRRVAYALVLLLAVVTAGLVASTSCKRESESLPPSQLSKAEQKIVDRYLEALARRDVEGLLKLAHPFGDRRAAAEKEIAQFGGRQLTNVQLQSSYVDTPEIRRVAITATDQAGKPFAHVIDLVREQGKWYLSLENTGPPPSERMPAGTDRSPTPSP